MLLTNFSIAYLNVLRWNKALWLDVPSQFSSFDQSEGFISALYSYFSIVKLCYEKIDDDIIYR